MFERSMGQVRYAMSVADGRPMMIPHGLDFAAVISFARELGAASPLFAELLPEIEAIIIRAGGGEDE